MNRQNLSINQNISKESLIYKEMQKANEYLQSENAYLSNKDLEKLSLRITNIKSLKNSIEESIDTVYKNRNDIYENLITAVIAARYLSTIEVSLKEYEENSKIYLSLDLSTNDSELNNIFQNLTNLKIIAEQDPNTQSGLNLTFEKYREYLKDKIKSFRAILVDDKIVKNIETLILTIDNKYKTFSEFLETATDESIPDIKNNINLYLAEIQEKMDNAFDLIKRASNTFIRITLERESNDSYYNSAYTTDLNENFSEIIDNIEVLLTDIDTEEIDKETFYTQLKESIISTEKEILNIIIALTAALSIYKKDIENYQDFFKSYKTYAEQFESILNRAGDAIHIIDKNNKSIETAIEEYKKLNPGLTQAEIDSYKNQINENLLNYVNDDDSTIVNFTEWKEKLLEYVEPDIYFIGSLYICQILGINYITITKISNYLQSYLNEEYISFYKKKLFINRSFSLDIITLEKALEEEHIILSKTPEYELIPPLLTNIIPELSKLDDLDISNILQNYEEINIENEIIKNIQIIILHYLSLDVEKMFIKISELNRLFSTMEKNFKTILIEYAYKNLVLMILNKMSNDFNLSQYGNIDKSNIQTEAETKIINNINSYKKLWLFKYQNNLGDSVSSLAFLGGKEFSEIIKEPEIRKIVISDENAIIELKEKTANLFSRLSEIWKNVFK